MSSHSVRALAAIPGLAPHHIERIRAVSDKVEIVFEPGVPLRQLDSRLVANAPVEVVLADGLPDPWTGAGSLRWIQIASAGVDQDICSPIWSSSSVVVTTAAGVYAPAISQWVLSVMLYYAQRLDEVLAFKASRQWPSPPRLIGTLLAGQTLGIVGYGSIGRECARLGRALGMRVLATHYGHGPATERFVPRVLRQCAPLAEPVKLLPPSGVSQLLDESDYLVLAAPLTSETRNLLDRPALARLKPSAVLINVARGALLDETALVEALRSGRLACAMLDVFAQEPLPSDSPLFDAPRTLLTPHVSGAFHELWDLVVELFCDNLERYVSHQPLLNVAQRERGY